MQKTTSTRENDHNNGVPVKQQTTSQEEYLTSHFSVVEYLIHVCTQLNLSAHSKATACMLYHKVQIEQKKLNQQTIDSYVSVVPYL